MQIFVKTFDHQHTSSPSAWWCADLCLCSRMQIFIVLTPFFVPPSYPPPPRDPYPDPRRIHQRLRGASPWRYADLRQDIRPSTHQLAICLVVCRSLSLQQNANLHHSNSFLRSTKLPSSSS